MIMPGFRRGHRLFPLQHLSTGQHAPCSPSLPTANGKAALLGLIGVLYCGTAIAQEPPPTGHVATAMASPEQAARAHFTRGAALFQERNYAGAWLEFTSAYRLSNKPQLLYNMAKCERKLGREREALDHLRTYLKAVPNDPDAPLIRQELAELEAQVEREGQQTPPRPPESTSDARPPARPFPVYGTVAAGATLALVVVGGAVLGSTQSKYDNLRDTCAPNCQPDPVNQLRTQAIAGYTLLGLAGAGAVTTAVLLAIELRRGRTPAAAPPPPPIVQLRPIVSPLQVGLAGSF